MPRGTLFLVPASLGEGSLDRTLPPTVREVAAGLRYYIVENAKTARAELKRLGVAGPMRALDIRQLPARPVESELAALLEPVLAGESAGLMSEAGCPAVADPGAALVAAAHRAGIRVVPLVGPSSILLALMASGLNGQHFSFHGYLPVREPDRSRAIAALEREARRDRCTKLFIETPYRNDGLLTALIATCRADTRLCIARALTTDEELVLTRTIGEWRTAPRPHLDRLPTVFLIA